MSFALPKAAREPGLGEEAWRSCRMPLDAAAGCCARRCGGISKKAPPEPGRGKDAGRFSCKALEAAAGRCAGWCSGISNALLSAVPEPIRGEAASRSSCGLASSLTLAAGPMVPAPEGAPSRPSMPSASPSLEGCSLIAACRPGLVTILASWRERCPGDLASPGLPAEQPHNHIMNFESSDELPSRAYDKRLQCLTVQLGIHLSKDS